MTVFHLKTPYKKRKDGNRMHQYLNRFKEKWQHSCRRFRYKSFKEKKKIVLKNN